MLKKEYKDTVKKIRKRVIKNTCPISELQSFMDKYKRFNLRKRARVLSRTIKILKVNNRNQ